MAAAKMPQRTSLVGQVARIVREGIEQGRWPEHLPGELTLCREFQVSRATLRSALKVLEKEGHLTASQGRRRRVLRHAGSRTGAKVPRKVMLLAAVPLEKMSSFRIFLVDVLRGQLAKAGYEVEMSADQACFGRRPEKALEKLVREKRAAAWVLFSATAMMQRWFMKRGLPCVLAGSRHEGVTLPMVELDCHALGQHAAWQFLSRGHRRLAVLTPAHGMAGDGQTVAGFLQACAQKAPDAKPQVAEHDGTAGGIQRILQTWLESKRPSGILVTGAAHVLTVVTFLQRAGLRIPQEVSVMVRDHDPMLAYVLPKLTGYEMRPEVFGRQLARAVVALAREGAAAVKDRHLVPDFVRGESLADLSANQTSGRKLREQPGGRL